MRFLKSCAVVFAMCVFAGEGAAQEIEYPASFAETMPLYETALGPFTRPVTTSSAEAQAYFNQGIQFMFAFTPRDAAHAFREAQQRDPNCAMCYWGEAWAWGSNLNIRMRESNGPRAWVAVSRAVELAPDNASELEQGLIAAMAERYIDQYTDDSRDVLDAAYANAMAEMFERYPEDLDVGSFYADALMLLDPWGGSDIESEEVQLVHSVLEHVLERDIRHPLACHLYIHATEITVEPGKAEACAEFLGNSIPGASHINHMPSHTFNRIGRWGDAVRANIQAWHSDMKADIGEGFAIYPTHNLNMLLFAASMDGQGAIAIQAAKDYEVRWPNAAFFRSFALLRFGRFQEILDLPTPPERSVPRGLWDFARGYAHLRTGNVDSATAYLAIVDEAAATLADTAKFRAHTATNLLGATGGILRAELAREDGDLDAAIAALEAAIEFEDALEYDEPETLNFSARHWLGAILLEAQRPAEAEVAYRAALDDHPNNGWSLFGLEQAVRAQGRVEEADRIHLTFEEAWARSDTWIRGSRF